jgi:hypothetical protein
MINQRIEILIVIYIATSTILAGPSAKVLAVASESYSLMPHVIRHSINPASSPLVQLLIFTDGPVA